MLASRFFAALLALTMCVGSACNLAVKDDLDDADDVVDEAVDDIPDVDLNVKVCGDQTLSDLLKADGLSDDCRAKVESFLPSPQSSFESRLVVLGQSHATDGSRTLYVAGGDAEGRALFETAPTDLTVSLTIEGQVQVVASADLTVDLPITGDLLSLSIVNDYSASMRDADLADVEEIENDLVQYLPPIHETEVVRFSELVSVVQPLTSDQALLLPAVAVDAAYERKSTALYDGMGTALGTLVARERPIKVLLVSTDGAENASTTFTKDMLKQTRDQHGVTVIMLGALFANVSELKELAGERGVYVYARGYGRLKSAVAGLVDSLQHIAAVHLPPSADAAEAATVELAGHSVTVPLVP